MRRRGLLAWAAAAPLAGCARWSAPQAAALARQAGAQRPPRVNLEAVPFFPQTPLHCAPAALATVLQHHGVSTATPDQLADAVFLPARGGSLQLEVAVAARRHGAVATVLPPRLDALLDELAEGHPVLLLQNLGLALAPAWHYAVAVGYDLDERELILRSGTERAQRLGLVTFELTWARGGHWALAVLPPGQLPRSAGDDALLSAALAFARQARPADAARHWLALQGLAQQRSWPKEPALSVALGLARAQADGGDAPAAVATLQAAAQRHDSAAAWNNLALLQHASGRHQAAQEALAQARRSAAGEPRWRDEVERTAATLGGAAR